ncbi:MAG: caspase family protein, partial [Thiomargarita sp.]|nr:caspase family protein [Thiomargarita sp.]
MKNLLLLLLPILSACIADPPKLQTAKIPESQERGAEPILALDTKPIFVLDPQQKTVLSYTNSYALIIGQQNYSHGWSSLDSVHGEVATVEAVLKEQGFIVEKHLDLDSNHLEITYSNFIKKYGFQPHHRLLFFFSGHGYSRFEGKKGYIVPIDAPLPFDQESEFLQKALSMNKIRALATEIEAKHALFLFDSCFSGTLFKDKAASTKAPAYITDAIAHQTRQFITAGRAKEKVPANSVFTPAFVDA